MKSYRKELWFNVPSRRDFINITSQVEECLRESGIQEGLVLVNAMHITASVYINDDWHLTSRSVSTATIVPAKTTQMLISSGRSWAARWSLP
jgi:thiamine phosphate synthase YjbQ (UPF0047 family)